MLRSRAEYLINKLIASKLSIQELDELLAGIGNEEDENNYSDVLEKYFDDLLNAHENNLNAQKRATATKSN
jgi:hypothetical protein